MARKTDNPSSDGETAQGWLVRRITRDDHRLKAAEKFSLDGFRDDPAKGVILPDGNSVFGFWPGGKDVFIGTETTVEGTDNIVDKTWFFDHRWQLQGWTHARRLADAADGRSLLLRANDDDLRLGLFVRDNRLVLAGW